jgi:8-oxo-dGTP pyrophosphatase MutT (NUDIX family)
MEQRHLLPPGAPDRRPLNPDAIACRLARGHDPRGRGDVVLERAVDGESAPARAASARAPTPASVLVALVQYPDTMTLLLTQRTDHLAHHPGQISFPGGRLEEADDGDAITCALRETEEEIGLPRDRVTVLGRLDDYVTGTGFVITPVVGVIQPQLDLSPDPFEVAEIFEVPLTFVLDPDNHKLHRRIVEGRHRPFWAMTWEQRVIWGATAGILVNLSEVLAAEEAPRLP